MNKFVRVTRDVVRGVRREVERELGRRYRMEFGLRTMHDNSEATGNVLLWREGADLVDTFLFAPTFSEPADLDNAGMVLFDFYLYEPGGGSLSGNIWVLLSNAGECLDVSTSWTESLESLATHKPIEEAKIARREMWVEVVAKWRARAGMPTRRVPIGILADWVEDHDDAYDGAQEDVRTIRAAIAAGYKG